MRISFITTIFNEEKTIERFLESVFTQTKLPDEIILVDGGSTDGTVAKIKDVRSKMKEYKGKFLVLVKKGNRSVGRNEAIRKATGDIILCSDAGNILDKNWVKNISKPFVDKKVAVVAGYYQGVATNVFQKCVIPYACVMPDKVDPDTFLPSTRSVAFTKVISEKVGGFDVRFSHNEDYVFARKLQSIGVKIVFAQDAIVYWMPRNSFRQAFVMMYRFAYGDAEARIFRPKVMLVFARYITGMLLLIVSLVYQDYFLLYILCLVLLLYIFWAIWKNYRYVQKWQALLILPALQFSADWAVLKGTTLGILNRKIAY